MKKGRKDIIKAHAEQRGESLNGFVNRAIDEAMERDAATADDPEAIRAARQEYHAGCAGSEADGSFPRNCLC